MKKITLLMLGIFLVLIFTLPAKANESTSFFSRFDIEEIAVKGHKLHIRGGTDLPPGSKLHLDVSLPWAQFFPNKKMAVKVRVNSNHFFAMVDLPRKKDYKGLSVILKGVFRPSEQEKNIKAAVGVKGEKLGGQKAVREKGETILREFREFIL